MRLNEQPSRNAWANGSKTTCRSTPFQIGYGGVRGVNLSSTRKLPKKTAGKRWENGQPGTAKPDSWHVNINFNLWQGRRLRRDFSRPSGFCGPVLIDDWMQVRDSWVKWIMSWTTCILRLVRIIEEQYQRKRTYPSTNAIRPDEGLHCQ